MTGEHIIFIVVCICASMASTVHSQKCTLLDAKREPFKYLDTAAVLSVDKEVIVILLLKSGFSLFQKDKPKHRGQKSKCLCEDLPYKQLQKSTVPSWYTVSPFLARYRTVKSAKRTKTNKHRFAS